MPSIPIEICEHCGAKMVEYKHIINKMLVEALWKLKQAGGAANASKIGLTNNQWNNFQKLRYWGLIEKYKKSGMNIKGWWSITIKGRMFLDRIHSISEHVVTYRGEPVREEGREVKADDYLDSKYWDKDDYVENSSPREDKKGASLFD